MPIQKEILRPGQFKDGNGNIFVCTVAKMKSIIKNFDETTSLNSLGNPVSFTIAHPKTDTPAFGWAKSFFMKGDRLWVEFKDVLPKMQKWLADKSFKDVSAALFDFPGKTIARHIGCLGAWPPAVSALADFKLNVDGTGTVQLSEDEQYIEIELNEENPNPSKGDNPMPKTIEDLSAEVGTLNSKVTDLEAKNAELTSNLETAIEAKKTQETELTESKKKVTELEKENKEFEASAEKAEGEKADLADSQAMDKLIEGHKVLPGEKEAHLAALKALRGGKAEEIELADGKKEKLTPVENYLRKQDERPVLELSEELFKKEEHSGDEAKGLTRAEVAVNAELTANPKLSHGEALTAAIAKNPELNKDAYGNAPAK